MASAVIDSILGGLLVISIVINCMSIGIPLRDRGNKNAKKVSDKKIYGKIHDDNKLSMD